MQAKLFVFYYTYSKYNDGQILVLSKKQDILELPYFDMADNTEELVTLEQAIKMLTSTLNISVSSDPKILDVIYSCHDRIKQLYLYYMVYVPLNRMVDHDNNYTLVNINDFISNSIIRRFLCLV